MSFWDTAKSIGKAVGKTVYDGMKEEKEQYERCKERYERWDDDRLIQKYKSATGKEKLACAVILKERGYGVSDED